MYLSIATKPLKVCVENINVLPLEFPFMNWTLLFQITYLIIVILVALRVSYDTHSGTKARHLY